MTLVTMFFYISYLLEQLGRIPPWHLFTKAELIWVALCDAFIEGKVDLGSSMEHAINALVIDF